MNGRESVHNLSLPLRFKFTYLIIKYYKDNF